MECLQVVVGPRLKEERRFYTAIAWIIDPLAASVGVVAKPQDGIMAWSWQNR